MILATEKGQTKWEDIVVTDCSPLRLWRPAWSPAYLGELGPGVRVCLSVHLDVHDVGLPLRVGDEGVLTRVPAVVQHLRLAGGTPQS